MDAIAHGLWGAAGAITAKKRFQARISIPWTAFWAMFPDLLAFGPGVAIGLWLRFTDSAALAGRGGHLLPRVHLGFSLYPFAHSLITFAIVFGIVSLVARRFVLSLLGWLSHVLIDIPTHSHSYYATRFLWPFSNYGIDGIPWWTPWFWACTYAGLAAVYLLLWRKGWLKRAKPREKAEIER